jgi:hypothetical protein
VTLTPPDWSPYLCLGIAVPFDVLRSACVL